MGRGRRGALSCAGKPKGCFLSLAVFGGAFLSSDLRRRLEAGRVEPDPSPPGGRSAAHLLPWGTSGIVTRVLTPSVLGTGSTRFLKCASPFPGVSLTPPPEPDLSPSGFSAETAAMPVTVTRTTITTTTSSSSGLGSPTIVGSPRALTQPLGLLRLLQLLSTCVAFSLVASVGAWTGAMGNWSMFTWCFCFAVTLIILIVELGGLQSRFPLSWRNFPITYACYAALFCLSASIIYPTTYVQFLPHGRSRDHAIAATAFSCIACVAYATEVAWTRARPGEITGYMATVPGLLKVLETFVACIIFAFISNPSLYQHQPALEWCVAVYSICFILAAVAILLNLGDCTNMLPISFPSFLSGLALLSVLLYATALVLWPLYQFNEKYGGQPRRSRDVSCANSHTYYVCAWDRRLAVAILTAINLLAYVADLVYSARLVFVRV